MAKKKQDARPNYSAAHVDEIIAEHTQALRERDKLIDTLQENLRRAGEAKSADSESSGRVSALRSFTGPEFLRALDEPRNAVCAAPASAYGTVPTNPDEALMKAKHGDLELFHPRPYSPSPEMHALSETIALRTQVQKLERMVRFLVERA